MANVSNIDDIMVVKPGDQTDFERMTINDLDDDCLISLFYFLPTTDMMKIEGVCTRWYELSRATWAIKKQYSLSIRDFLVPTLTASTTDKIVRWLIKRCGRFLKSLEICYACAPYEADSLILVANHCQRLRKLVLSDISLSAPGVRALRKSCKMIEELDFSLLEGDVDDEIALLLKNSPNLIKLTFTCISTFTGRCLTSIVSERFESLTITNCESFDGKHLRSADQLIKTMKNLELSYITECTDADLAPIFEKCKTLVYLKLAGMPSVSGKCFVNLVSERFTSLKVVLCEMFNMRYLPYVSSLENFYFESREDDERVPHLQFISTLKKLKRLQLSLEPFYTYGEDALTQLVETGGLKKLTSLRLDNGIRVDDRFLQQINKNCRLLKKFDCNLLSQVSYSGLEAILDLPLLEQLELTSFGDERIPSSKKLVLNGYALTDKDIVNLVMLDEVIPYIRDYTLQWLIRIVHARSNKNDLEIWFFSNGGDCQINIFKSDFCQIHICPI